MLTRTHPSIITLPRHTPRAEHRLLLGDDAIDTRAPQGAAISPGSLTVIAARAGQGRTRAALRTAAANIQKMDDTDRKVVIAAADDRVSDSYLHKLTQLGVTDDQLLRNVALANVGTVDDIALLMATVIADAVDAAAANEDDVAAYMPELLVVDDAMIMRTPHQQSFNSTLRSLTDLFAELGSGAFHLGVVAAIGDRADRLTSFARTRNRPGAPSTHGLRVATVMTMQVMTMQEPSVGQYSLSNELTQRAELVVNATMPTGEVTGTTAPELTVSKSRHF